MVWVRSRHTKREMCVRAAQLHLQGRVDRQARWTTIRERPRDLKVQPQRIDMLPDGTHRARRLSRVVVRSSGAETLYRRPTVTYDWKVSSRPTARDIPANHPGISPLLDTLHDLLGIAAHDISNPLQTVSVLLEILQTVVEDDHPASKRLLQAEQAGERLRTLVKAFGDLARALPSSQRPRDAREIINAIRGLLSRRCERGQLSWIRTREEVLVLAQQVRGPLHLDVGAFLLGALAVTTSRASSTFELVQIADADLERGDVSISFELFETSGGDRVATPIDSTYVTRILSAGDTERDYDLDISDPHRLLIKFTAEGPST